MLAAILAKKKAALAAIEDSKFPARAFIDMAMIYDPFHGRDPVRSLELLANWLEPEGMACVSIPATPIPSALGNWQILALSNMTEVSQEQIWTLILAFINSGRYKPRAYQPKPKPERNHLLQASSSVLEDF